MSFEKPPEFSDPTPEHYSQYKQERGPDLKARDFAHYFNGKILVASAQLDYLKSVVERAEELGTEGRKKMLESIAQIEDEIETAYRIANDAFHVVKSKERE